MAVVEHLRGTHQSKARLLEQFDDNIFKALVEKIDMLTQASFCFVLKSGMEIKGLLMKFGALLDFISIHISFSPFA
ncbi:hypothetical protein PaeBR_03075 [Paenibacillus sp. BR2-3]|uniref:hypothetical protein n=1 Tax=Paenibacillus sp. BR2-3 TaxID=3048494 RepID=UPI00397797FD